MKCEICYDNYNAVIAEKKPRMLECGHSYCTKCIDNLIRNNPRCAKCRSMINVNSSNNLPINYAIIDFLDARESSSPSEANEGSDEISCSKHENKNSKYFCTPCNKSVCEVCALMYHDNDECKISSISERRMEVKRNLVKSYKENSLEIIKIIERISSHPVFCQKSFFDIQEKQISDIIKAFKEKREEIDTDIEKLCEIERLDLLMDVKEDLEEKFKNFENYKKTAKNQLEIIHEDIEFNLRNFQPKYRNLLKLLKL